MPHKAIRQALDFYHVPEKLSSLLMTYYEGLFCRVSTRSFTSDYHRLERGIMMGCSISPILFVTAFNLPLTRCLESPGLYEFSSPDLGLVPVQTAKGYVDDVVICTTSARECRKLLHRFDSDVKNLGMALKPAKCRSLSIQCGKVLNRELFKLGDTSLPTVVDQPTKFLGKFVDVGRCRSRSSKIYDTVLQMMKKIDRSPLSGDRKLWCWNFVGLARLRWTLQIYDLAWTAVKKLDRLGTKFVRKWLCVSRSLSACALYSSANLLSLPFSSIATEYKAATVQWQLQLEDSKDGFIAGTGIVVGKAGRKWNSVDAAADAESSLRWKEMTRGQEGVSGLGVIKHLRISQLKGKTRRKAIVNEVRSQDSAERNVQLSCMASQGRWSTWEQAQSRSLSWRDILSYNNRRLSFLIGSVFDTLPSQANLHRWRLEANAECLLCKDSVGSLDHVLAGCRRALADGRYRFRHDNVLRALAEVIEARLGNANAASVTDRPPDIVRIPFVKAGAKAVSHTSAGGPHVGLLCAAADWRARIDIDRQLVFPILETPLRPDIVIWSNTKRVVIIAELTVPLESRIAEAHERKMRKYEDLAEQCREAGWKVELLAVEVGCRGFPTPSLQRFLTCIGLCGRARASVVDRVCEKAESASFWIWVKRDSPWDRSSAPVSDDIAGT